MNRIEALRRKIADEESRIVAQRYALELSERTLRHLEFQLTHAQSDTPVGDGTTRCSGCGEDVSTEAKFSQHYVIPDYRLANIGHCPNKGK